MAVLVPACLEANLDPVAGTCSAVIWIPQSSLLPELTVEGAYLIGGKIAVLWAIAYAFRLVRKHLNQS